MKKRAISFLLGFLFLSSVIPAYAASDDPDTCLHRSNVVFVTDESGSMQHTDPDDNRYEAIRLFLGEMADTGNYAGSVSFGEGIVDTSPVRHMNGQAVKDALLADISNQEYSNYTNIGMGLLQAVDLLDSGRNQKLDSAIILLTDGNTAMPNKDQLQGSAEMKADAIERARQNGYKIYTICLNVNGEADSAELRQIAEATGGEFSEIGNSESLNDVETMFNKLIFHSFEDSDFSGLEFVLGADGTVATEFLIPNIGVEELNVLFEGKLSDCKLSDPQGQTFQRDGSGAVFVDGNDFLLVKIKEPAGGVWTAVAYGDPNTAISLRLLYNSDFYVTAELRAPSPVQLKDTVEVVARLGGTDGIVQDVSRYSDVSCSVHISYAGTETVYPMQLSQGGFSYSFSVQDEGTYYISVSASRADMEAAADETFEISVNNTAPLPVGEGLSAHANIWPIFGGSASVDLSAGAEDPEGQALTYRVKSTAFNAEDYVLEDHKLTVSQFSIPKGSFEIIASDPYGAYCTFNVSITSTNIGLIMAVMTLAGVAAAVIAVILGIRAAMGKALIGCLSVASFDTMRALRTTPAMINHGRGTIALSAFSVDTTALPQKCRFQCDGRKRQVWLISSTPVYADNMVGAAKKIRITGDGIPVRISGDRKMERGITVTFKSDIPDPLGMAF